MEEPEGEEEEAGPLADVLPRLLPEVPSSPVLKARRAVIKKIKMKQPRAPQGGPHSMLCPYTQDELVDMSIQYRQRPSESLPTWLLSLWDMGWTTLLCWVLR